MTWNSLQIYNNTSFSSYSARQLIKSYELLVTFTFCFTEKRI